MHSLMINSSILNKILKIIIIETTFKTTEFHLLYDDDILTFQINYDCDFYVSHTLNISKLVYFDSLEFVDIVLNYDQCLKLRQLTELFVDATIAVGCLDGKIEIVVSHSNVKLIFNVDVDVDVDSPIIPPNHNLEIPYITLNRKLLNNVIKLAKDKGNNIPIRIVEKKSRIIVGCPTDIVPMAVIQLPRQSVVEDSSISINPDSIISFLNNLEIENVQLKVNNTIAFTLHFIFSGEEVYYYRGHDRSPN